MEIIEGLQVGGESKLLVFAGPCQLESREHALRIASSLCEIAGRVGVSLVFKSSYDKANRTSVTSGRGVGIHEGLEILSTIKRELGVGVITDVHTESQAATAGEVVDILQIPAFLCRQTDLLIAAGASGKAVNIKKGQFLHPADMKYAAQKVESTGNRKVLLCERGTCFGYRDLVVDMRGLAIMRALGYPVVFDVTHSVQSMGGAGGQSTGSRSYIPPLLRAALGVGVDGIFIECHDNPALAPSDGPNMVPLEYMERVLILAKSCFEFQRRSQMSWEGEL